MEHTGRINGRQVRLESRWLGPYDFEVRVEWDGPEPEEDRWYIYPIDGVPSHMLALDFAIDDAHTNGFILPVGHPALKGGGGSQ